MKDIDAVLIADLQARIAAGQVAMQCARDDLIERLGDHLCGAPSGAPGWRDLKTLARARRTTRQAQRELAELLTQSAITTLRRPTTLVRTPPIQPGSAPNASKEP
jgi:hypothetical protein